jgi:hypothetical protein
MELRDVDVRLFVAADEVTGYYMRARPIEA